MHQIEHFARFLIADSIMKKRSVDEIFDVRSPAKGAKKAKVAVKRRVSREAAALGQT
jgi:hypothetical protein